MLTGRTAFAGDTLSDTIAAILSREPERKTLPGSTPERVRDLLRRCLHKDPKRRLHDIADARIEIDEALTAPPAETAPAASSTIVRPPSPWRRIAAFAMAALVAGIAVWLATRPVLPPPRVLRLTITPPSAAAITISGTDRDLAITPDVTHVVYGATGTLRAVSFDLANRAVVGPPVPVVSEVVSTVLGAVDAVVGGDGTLVYVPGRIAATERR